MNNITYFQFLIYRKIIKSRLKDLNRTHVKNQGKVKWMKTATCRQKAGEGDSLSIVQNVDVATLQG